MKIKLLFLTLLSSLLLCNFSKAQIVTCNASFTENINGFAVNFTPAFATDSINTTHNWNFGDGTANSTLIYANHTYANVGIYLVKHALTRKNPNGTILCADTFLKTIQIQNSPNCNIQAYFTFVKDSINKKKVYFTNQTANFLATDSIRWSFGDGTAYNYDINPIHTYNAAGTYNVCIRVKRNTITAGGLPCVSEFCKVVIIDSIITTPPCNMQAYFTFIKDSINKKKVYFTNQTANFLATDSIRWSFGDGTAYNYDINPIHTYNAAGTYNVCIRVKRNTITVGGLPCVSEFCKVVIIDSIITTPPCNMQAYFSFVKDSINKKKVYFTNQTINFLATDSIRWNFGDGTAYNYTQNPVHTYTTNGIYNVCIRVVRNVPNSPIPCVSELCKVVVIDSVSTTPNCNYLVDFNTKVDSLNARKVYFTNVSLYVTGAVATWTFGDGTTSNSWNADHIYANGGMFNVCLKIKYSATCTKEKCRVIQLLNTVACILQPYPNPAVSVVNASVQLTTPYVIYTRVISINNIIMLQQQQNGLTGFNTVTVNVATLPVGMYRSVVRYGNKECKGTFFKSN
jgi:PKD repeat protein